MLYFFDALQTLGEDTLIFDPDVFCLENLDKMFSRLSNKIAVFKPGFDSLKWINGITPKSASEFFSLYSKKNSYFNPEHIGGEAIYFPKELINPIVEDIARFWSWNAMRAKKGLSFLTTEEHILTVLLQNY